MERCRERIYNTKYKLKFKNIIPYRVKLECDGELIGVDDGNNTFWDGKRIIGKIDYDLGRVHLDDFDYSSIFYIEYFYTPVQIKPIFKSNEEAIKTAEIMFACTGFQPWTKEKIIKRLKEKGLIEETHSEPVRHDQEETEEDIIRTNLIPLVKQLLGKEYNTYMYNAYRWEKKFLGKSLTYKEWLKALLPKEVNNDNSNRE